MYKYTKDNRKVKVLKALGDGESLVQEVLVKEGKEFPGGEKFVIKELLDAPVETWKEKNLRELNTQYEESKRLWLIKNKNLNKEWRTLTETLQNKINSYRGILKNLSAHQLENLDKFLSGKFKYVICLNEYGRVPLFREFNSYFKDRDVNLLNFFGSTKGDCCWRINTYKDNSGNWEYLHFFETKKEAKAFQKTKLLECRINDSVIDLAKKLEVELNPTLLKNYHASKKESLSSTIKIQEKRLLDLKKQLETYDI